MALAALLASSCHEEEVRINVNPDQLYGLWVKNGTQEYWRYLSDSTGVTWDVADDITEEESNLRFEWSVEGDVLTHIFRGEQGNQAVPKVYTIKGISASSMSWRDDYGINYTLIKVAK